MPPARISKKPTAQKNHIILKEKGDQTFAYTPRGRELLNDREVYERFVEFTKQNKTRVYEDPKGRFAIVRFIGGKEDVNHLQRSYILEIKNKAGNVESYFIKEEKTGKFASSRERTAIYDWEDSITESKALKILSDYLRTNKVKGIEIVPFKFAFYDKSTGVSYICYDYLDSHHLTTLYHSKKMNTTEYLKINKRLRELESEVNVYLNKNLVKYGVERGTELTDISPEFTFYDAETKKLKLFNPVLLK